MTTPQPETERDDFVRDPEQDAPENIPQTLEVQEEAPKDAGTAPPPPNNVEEKQIPDAQTENSKEQSGDQSEQSGDQSEQSEEQNGTGSTQHSHQVKTHAGNVTVVDKNYDVFGHVIDASHDECVDVNAESVLPAEKIMDLTPQLTSGITKDGGEA